MKRAFMAALLALIVALPMGALAGDRAVFYGNGDRAVNKVAITIDDWYEAALLPEFMAVAERYDVKLTMYPSGFNVHVEDGPLWQAALDAGHEIGSHGFAHKRYTERSAAQIAKDFVKFGEALDAALGYHYEFLSVRIPFGDGRAQGTGGKVGRALHNAGFNHIVFWDWDDTKDLKGALKKIKNGSIVLMHANRQDLKFFEELMAGLADKGFEYVTISELLHLSTRLETVEEIEAMNAPGDI